MKTGGPECLLTVSDPDSVSSVGGERRPGVDTNSIGNGYG